MLSGPAVDVAATQALFGPVDEAPLPDLGLDLAAPASAPLAPHGVTSGADRLPAFSGDGTDTLELPIEATQILDSGGLAPTESAEAGDATQAAEAAETATLQSLPAAVPELGSLGDLTLDLGAPPMEPEIQSFEQPPADLPIELPAEPTSAAFADSANDALAAP